MAAAAVLPALILIAFEQSAERRRVQQDTLETNLRITRLAADRVASTFLGIARLLQTLAHVPDLGSRGSRVCRGEILANVLADHPGYLNLAVIGADGTVWCSSSEATVSTAIADRPWFQRVMAARTPVVGGYQIGRTSGSPSVVIALPILDASGRVEPVLAASLSLADLNRLLSTIQGSPGGTLTLFDKSRTILAHHPNGPQWIGKQIESSLPLDRLLAGAQQDSYETVGPDGVRRLYATVVVNTGLTSDLFVSVGTDTAAALADATRIARRQIVLLAVVLLAVMTTALIGGHTLIIHPVNTLRAVTRRLAEGDLGARVSLEGGVEELSALGDTVNAMAVSIENRERERDDAERGRRLLASIVDDSEDAILSKRLDGVITSWNPGAERLYGYSADEIVGQSVLLLTPTDRIEELNGLLDGLRRGEHYKHYETVRVRKNGSLVPVSLTVSPIRDDTGSIVGASSIARDTTERTRAVEALRNAEERLRFALEAARVGVWEANLTTGVAFWSETTEVMHGLAPGTFGRTVDAIMERIHPEDRRRVQQTLETATRERKDAELEYRTTWPDGTEHQISATGRFVYDDTGRPLRGAGIMIDVSERRSLEDQLRQAQKMEAIGQLAGGIAHDFNNVLTAILGNAEFVLDDLPRDSPLRTDLHEIKIAAERAAGLTHQLLAFSRKQILAPRVLHLGDIVSGVAPMLRRLLGETIEMRVSVRDRGHVKADAGQIEQVLLNLAVNARDAMPDGGQLTIETADVMPDDVYARQHPTGKSGPHVMILVKDTGHGMDDATQTRIFEPFFTTKGNRQGTGLGLATVYGIVKQSDGSIWVDSEPGRGTTFTIYLPRTVEAESVATAPPPDARPAGGTETILLVEDEEFVREFVHKVLSRNGYTVHSAPNAARGIAFAEKHGGSIDLILTDVVLPDQNGRLMAIEVLRKHPEADVLYMSGYTDDAIVHQGVLDPGTSFIQKPFAANELSKRVREILDDRRLKT